MKVALISFHNFSNPGGVKRHILGLFKEFKKRGVKAKIIVPRRKISENYGKNVIILGTSVPVNFGGSQSDFDINFNPISIERVLKREKFDVLHFHNAGLPSSLQILISPSAFNSLKIITAHAYFPENNFLDSSPSLLNLICKLCDWKIDGIIGVAPLTLKYFKHYQGLKGVIPNGIDLERFNPQVPKIKKFSDDKTNILFVGRIEERKGLIYLLRAYNILEKKFKKLRLIVVGEGPLKKDCKDYIKKNNLKEVVFEGQIVDKIASYYRTADIFVAPSIFGESFGLVLLESMACGTPVAAFANKGYAGFLKHKAGGRFLAKPKDYKELAEKIGILIKKPELRKRLAQKGIKEAKEYSWSKIADQVLDFYEFCKKYKTKKRRSRLSRFEEKLGKWFTKIPY